MAYKIQAMMLASVQSVTADAVNDEQRDAICPAVLTLQADGLNVDRKAIRLRPGMNLKAGIKMIGGGDEVDELLTDACADMPLLNSSSANNATFARREAT